MTSLSKMTRQELREHVACVKDLFEIAKTTRLLCDEGHLELQDAQDIARQTAHLGMMMWEKSWTDLLKKFPEHKDNQKIDRGEHVVVK